MTAFLAPGDVTTDVSVLKNAISSASFHGKSPPFPIPRDVLAATTMEKCRMKSYELLLFLKLLSGLAHLLNFESICTKAKNGHLNYT